MAQYVDNLEVAGKALASAMGIFTRKSLPRAVFTEGIRPVQFAVFDHIFDLNIWNAWLEIIGHDSERIAAWDASGDSCLDYLVILQKLPLVIGYHGIRDVLAMLKTNQATVPILEFQMVVDEVWIWDMSSSWACWAHRGMNLAVFGVSPSHLQKARFRQSQGLAFEQVVGTACQYFDDLSDPEEWLERYIAANYASVWE